MKSLMAAVSILAISIGSASLAGNDRDRDRDDDKVEQIAGPKGDTGAQGPKGDTGATGAQGAKGDTGATGSPGKDGAPGLNGTSFDYTRYMNDLSTTASLGGVELRTPTDGVWSYGIGIGGIVSEGDSAEAISGGIRYGISDERSLYGKVSVSLDGNSTAWYIGYEGQF